MAYSRILILIWAERPDSGATVEESGQDLSTISYDEPHAVMHRYAGDARFARFVSGRRSLTHLKLSTRDQPLCRMRNATATDGDLHSMLVRTLSMTIVYDSTASARAI